MAARRFVALLVLLAVVPLAPADGPRPSRPRPRFKGPLGIAFGPTGRVAYVALHSADSLALVDWLTGRVQAEVRVGKKPYDVALHGEIAYVSCEADDTVVAVNLRLRRVVRTWQVGQAPRGLAIDSATGTIRVVCHDDRALWTLDPRTGKARREPLPPQPPGNLARATNVVLRPGSPPSYRQSPRPHGLFLKAEAAKPGPPGTERTAFSFAHDVNYRSPQMDLVAHNRPRWFVPTAQPQDGRITMTAFSFFLNPSTPARVVLDDPNRGYPDPSDVVVRLPAGMTGGPTLPLLPRGNANTHPLKGARAFISSGGADAVLVLDLYRAAKHFEANRPRPQQGIGFGGWGGGGEPEIPEDLKASGVYTLARLPTQANPRRLALTPDGKALLVSNHLADSLTVIDAERLRVVRHIFLNGGRPDTARRGEILFHSSRLTFRQHFTCATCHPNGGTDGLQWNTAPKGVGETLDTRALWGVRDTAPFGWDGESPTLEERATRTMRGVHRHALTKGEALAIAAYLKTLDPPRPLPQPAGALAAIERGKALFLGKGECHQCHRGPAFDSPSRRAVIANGRGQLLLFDVPSLRGVARTGPYLHDGRAATLAEIFEKHNPGQRHGQAHRLTAAELRDLLAFVGSL